MEFLDSWSWQDNEQQKTTKMITGKRGVERPKFDQLFQTKIAFQAC